MKPNNWVCLEWKRNVKGQVVKMSDDKMTAFVQFVDPVPLPVTELLRTKPPKKKKTTKVEQKQTIQKHADGLLHCSFCGLSQGQVAKLIAGPNVYICSDCLKICIQILVEDGLLKDHYYSSVSKWP